MLATGQTAEVSARTIVTEEIVVVKKTGTLLLRPHLHHLLCLFQERLTTRSALLQDRSRKRVLFALDQRVLGILSRVSNHATQKTNTIEGIFDQDQDQEEDGMDSATCTKLVALLVSFKN